MDAATRFFGPLGANEMFVSALLGWSIEVFDDARGYFFDAVEAQAHTSNESDALLEVIRLLRHAEDVSVSIEPYLTAGNIDIAVFSRRENAVLAIEHKAGSSLARRQITKYRLALRAADPDGNRKLGTVLLRPKKACSQDENADPMGFGASCKLTHPDLSPVFAVIADRVEDAGLGSHILRAALDCVLPTPNGMPRGTDCRGLLLNELVAATPEVGWRLMSRTDLSLKLTHPVLDGGHLQVRLGFDPTNMLRAQIYGSSHRLRILPEEQEPTHLFDLWPNSAALTFPTPFPGHPLDKPWFGDRPEERARQVRVATSLLAKLPDHLVR
jgi:hypothetical protein